MFLYYLRYFDSLLVLHVNDCMNGITAYLDLLFVVKLLKAWTADIVQEYIMYTVQLFNFIIIS